MPKGTTSGCVWPEAGHRQLAAKIRHHEAAWPVAESPSYILYVLIVDLGRRVASTTPRPLQASGLGQLDHYHSTQINGLVTARSFHIDRPREFVTGARPGRSWLWPIMPSLIVPAEDLPRKNASGHR